MSERPMWQTPESAPQDGSPILVQYPDTMAVVRWCGWGGGVWQCCLTGHNVLSSEFSHWQPLPKGPNE